jgi:hypothetical protein
MKTEEEKSSMISADEVKVTVGCRVSATQKMKREAEAKQKGYPSLSQYLEAILSGKENISSVKTFVNLKDEDLEQIESRFSFALDERMEVFSNALEEVKDSISMLGDVTESSISDPKGRITAVDIKKLYSVLNVDEETAQDVSTELNRLFPSSERVKELLMLGSTNEPTDEVDELKLRLHDMTVLNEFLEKELNSITENEKFKELYESHKGKKLAFKTPSGEKREQEIEVMSDLVNVLCETVFDNSKN